MNNNVMNIIKNYMKDNKRYYIVFASFIIGTFFFEMFYVSFFGPYYVTFTKIWSAFAIGSFFAALVLYTGKYVTAVAVGAFVFYIILYTISVFGIVQAFDRLPKFSDLFNLGVLISKYSVFVVLFGFILYFSLILFFCYKMFKVKKHDWRKLDALPIAILSVYMIILQLANKPRILPNGEVWHSYSTYVQSNRNIYGKYAIAEWGLFNSAFMNESRWRPSTKSPFLTPEDTASDRNGIFENKNLNIVLLESFDNVNVNSLATPTLNSIRMNNSINFTNYHVTVTHNSSCRSEATIISGLYSAPAYDCPWFEPNLVEEVEKENIFELFKNKGYDTAYYHSNGGSTYNRKNIIRNLKGLDSADFFGGDNAGMLGGYRDHEYVETVELAKPGQKKMNFWFTYDGHAENKTIIEPNKEPLYQDLLQLHGGNDKLAKHGVRLSYLDEGIKKLIDKATSDDIFLFIADHPLYTDRTAIYQTYPERRDNDFYRVPMFIYNKDFTYSEVTNNVNTISVKTIINDLFKIDAKRLMGTNPLLDNKAVINFPNGDIYVDGAKHEGASLNWNTRHSWNDFAYEMSKYQFLEWI